MISTWLLLPFLDALPGRAQRLSTLLVLAQSCWCSVRGKSVHRYLLWPCCTGKAMFASLLFPILRGCYRKIFSSHALSGCHGTRRVEAIRDSMQVCLYYPSRKLTDHWTQSLLSFVPCLLVHPRVIDVNSEQPPSQAGRLCNSSYWLRHTKSTTISSFVQEFRAI